MAYNVKFLKGTQASFEGLQTKDTNTFYYVDNKDLYLGSIKLSNAAEVEAAVTGVGQNAEEISKIKTALGNLTQVKYDALVERMSAAEGKITAAEGKIAELETAKGDHETRLGAVEGLAAGHTQNITDLQTGLGQLTENAATKAELKATDDIAKANQTAIGVLNGEGVGSVKAQVAAGIAEVVAGADQDFDTLKEVADWILNDKEGAAKLQIDVAQLLIDVADHETRVGAAESDIDELQKDMEAVEKLAGENKAAHEKNAQDIVAANQAIQKNAQDIVAANTAIGTEKTRAEGAEKALADRLAVVEDLTGAGGEGETGAISEQIATAKAEAIAAAKTETQSQVAASEQTLRNEISTAQSEAVRLAGVAADAKYATLAQGAKADSALQKEDITTGATNGTIKVDGDEVAVAGLKSAAYAEASAFEVAGAAAAAESAAKAHADGLAKNYDPAGSAATAKSEAVQYVDAALTWGSIA